MNTCLTIAGSDSSGGAGIQADLKTFAAHGVYGMSAITALTAQNTLGVQGVSHVTPDFVAQQISSVFDDIRPDAVKIGMLANADVIQVVAQQLAHYKAQNVVLDPVMISTSGAALLDCSAIDGLIHCLIPHTDIITPNTLELVALAKAQNLTTPDTSVSDQHQLDDLSQALFETLPLNYNKQRVAILTKGGHLDGQQSPDLLISEQKKQWLHDRRIETANTHGTGCTLSAAICANIAQGSSLETACKQAKDYLSNALAKGLNLGAGNGPLNHLL